MALPLSKTTVRAFLSVFVETLNKSINDYEPRRDDSLLTGLETTKGKTVGTINILADGVEQ
jgi:hypothetical protein